MNPQLPLNEQLELERAARRVAEAEVDRLRHALAEARGATGPHTTDMGVDSGSRTADLEELNRVLVAKTEALEMGRLSMLDMIRDLEAARAAAESATRAKDEFLARMSHELRTPMNGVIGLTELLLDANLTAEQREQLEIVRSSGQSLLSVVDDVLDFANLESGRLALRPGPMVLRDELSAVLVPLARRAATKQLELVVRLGDDVPEGIHGDPGRLRQVIANLVGNAIKFTSRGDVTVEIERTQDPVDPRLVFRVRDTGVGMTREQLAVVFDPFQQIQGRASRDKGGTGLGLTLANRLVELMHGHLHAASAPGEGSSFEFDIPLRECAVPAGDERVQERLAGFRGRTLLVLEDHAGAREVVVGQLAALGFRTVATADASEAYTWVREWSSDAPLAGVLVDMGLHEVDGIDWLEQVRLLPGCEQIPALLMSASHNSSDIERAAAVGAPRFLLKPVLPMTLRAALADTLDREVTLEPVEIPRAERTLEVLLVDDIAVNRRVAQLLLERAGHRVTEARDGHEAIACWAPGRFDLILMDAHMPGMDGLEATRLIREREAITGGHTPILALTASAMREDRERCALAGMDGFLSKPVRWGTLAAEMARALDPSHDDSGHQQGAA